LSGAAAQSAFSNAYAQARGRCGDGIAAAAVAPQIDTATPLTLSALIDRAARLACPLPALGRGSADVEFLALPRSSPLGFIALGLNAALPALVFPPPARLKLLRHLLPLAGLDPADAGDWLHIEQLRERLRAALYQAARAAGDGQADARQTQIFIEQQMALPAVQARDWQRRIARQRSAAVIAVQAGPLLQRWLLANGAGAPVWARLHTLLDDPPTPYELQREVDKK